MKCACSPDGVEWLCSPENCSPQINREKIQTCAPNETFMRECNLCKCDSSGSVERCTERACYQNSRVKRSDESNRCNVGSTWKDGCSPCECMEGGIVSCIFKDCMTGASVGFRHGTNYGYRKDGLSPKYEEGPQNIKMVLGHQIAGGGPDNDDIPHISESDLEDPNFRCHPIEAMKLDCNTCWCNSRGDGIHTCTRIACRPTSYAPLYRQ